jgi:pyruvate formate lyase activating enzyme
MGITRRGFIKSIARKAISLAAATYLGRFWSRANEGELNLYEAKYYEKLPNKGVRCLLEPRRCQVNEGERGYCGARENRDGRYYSVVYASACAVHDESPENDHFYHVLPGRKVLGVSTAGCNLQCKFCETWEISQARPEDTKALHFPPEDLVAEAKKRGCLAILFTYNEPTVCFEYMLDTAKLAKKAGLKVISHTAGYIFEDPLREACQYLDAVNIDLKSFDEEYYWRVCGVRLELSHILKAMQTVRQTGTHLEITNLIVPQLSDSPEMIARMCKWIKDNLGADVPLHFARFFPNYQLMDSYSTPLETLERAWEIAKSVGLQFVYLDNVGEHKATATYCPKCGRKLIERSNGVVNILSLKGGRCDRCGGEIPGIWCSSTSF